MTIGERMLNYRARNGLSMRAFGNLIGESYQTIFRIEHELNKLYRVNEIKYTMILDKLEAEERKED